jgi:indolepyruvate ferredoxin oxidoreductase beta subunit
MMSEVNVLIAGVGGQGTVLMGELLGKAAVEDGLRVRGCEMIGAAQRGGAVTSMLRMGGSCEAPVIPHGKGNVMIALEPAEALRNIIYMSKSSIIILNRRMVIPVTTMVGIGNYAGIDVIIEKLKKNSSAVVDLDAIALAEQAGSGRSANMVMLGAAFAPGVIPIKLETIKAIIETRFREKVRLFNITAFDLGYRNRV